MTTKQLWKTAWVTGAGRGIGASLSRLLCQKGITVYGTARSAEQLSLLEQELKKTAGRFIPVVLDIRHRAAVEEVFRGWDKEGVMPDLVVLNAGTHDPFSAEQFSAQRCKELFDINLQGTINCLEPVLYRYLNRGVNVSDSSHFSSESGPESESGADSEAVSVSKLNVKGQVAVVSSVAGYRGLPTAAAYGASKAALINLCEALYADLQGTGVKLQLINPGFVRTPLTDKNDFAMPALMEPEDAAQRIFNGLQKNCFEIVFPRRFIYLLKLFRVLPYRWYFWLIAKTTAKAK